MCFPWPLFLPRRYAICMRIVLMRAQHITNKFPTDKNKRKIPCTCIRVFELPGNATGHFMLWFSFSPFYIFIMNDSVNWTGKQHSLLYVFSFSFGLMPFLPCDLYILGLEWVCCDVQNDNKEINPKTKKSIAGKYISDLMMWLLISVLLLLLLQCYVFCAHRNTKPTENTMKYIYIQHTTHHFWIYKIAFFMTFQYIHNLVDSWPETYQR